MINALKQIDWFRERGFLLGRDKSKDIYYVVDSGTGERYDFKSIQQTKQYVKNIEAYRIETDTPMDRRDQIANQKTRNVPEL